MKFGRKFHLDKFGSSNIDTSIDFALDPVFDRIWRVIAFRIFIKSIIFLDNKLLHIGYKLFCNEIIINFNKRYGLG